MVEAVVWALGAAFGVTGVTAAVVAYAVVIAASYAYGSYASSQARKAARDNFNANLKDRLVMTATTDNPRSRLYGKVRNCDGILFKATHGTNSEFYTLVVAIAGHEIDGFERIYFNDQQVSFTIDGVVTTAPYAKTTRRNISINLGAVTSGTYTLPAGYVAGSAYLGQHQDIGTEGADRIIPFTISGSTLSFSGAEGGSVLLNYQVDEITSKAVLAGFTGTDSQNVGAHLASIGVPLVNTSQFRFAGIACLVVTMTYDAEVYPSGVPNISALVRGARVYDPRNGLTVYSDNSALCARDWALYPYGGGAKAEEIDDSMVIAAANACDLPISLEVSELILSGNTLPGYNYTRPTWTCAMVAPTQTDPTAILQELTMSMAGKYAWAGGKLRMKAGNYTGPVATLDDSWLSGQGNIEVTSGVSRVDLVNAYRPTIADQTQDYVATPITPIRADAYITLDGQELQRDITMMAVSDPIQAQHIAGVLLRDARQALALKVPCNLKAYKLELFDTVAVALPRYGWDAKPFEVVAWEFSPTGGVLLTLKETDASIYDPDAGFSQTDAAPNTKLPLPWTPPPILTNVVVTSGTAALTDGSILTRTLITWDQSTVESVRQSGHIEVQYTLAFADIADGDWQSQRTEGSATSLTIPGLLTDRSYLFRVRAINSLDIKGRWTRAFLHKIATPPPASGTYQQEDPPTSPADGDLWAVPSSGVIFRWNDALHAWILFGAIGSDWTTIVGRPKLFRVAGNGFNSVTHTTTGGIFDGETGTPLVALPSSLRSYVLVRIRRSDGVITAFQTYDVFGNGALTSGRGSFALSVDLNNTDASSIVVVLGSDEPKANRLTGGLPESMYRHGASRAVFGSPEFKSRSAYVLIGIGGCGEGNGFEAYQGAGDNDPNAWVDVAFSLLNGNMLVTGSGATPRTLSDYSYTGTLDATTDLYLIARGNCVVAGNYISKVGGSAAWDSDCYSRDAFHGGGYASAVVVQSNLDVMFGLNSDPLATSSYDTIDHAMYLGSDGVLRVFGNGTLFDTVGSYAAGDVLAVVYDGSYIRYQKNGVNLRDPAPTEPDQHLYFDSSFNQPGGALRNVRFGPLSANNWDAIGNVSVTTGQIDYEAATQVYEVTTAYQGLSTATTYWGNFVLTNNDTFERKVITSVDVAMFQSIGGPYQDTVDFPYAQLTDGLVSYFASLSRVPSNRPSAEVQFYFEVTVRMSHTFILPAGATRTYSAVFTDPNPTDPYNGSLTNGAFRVELIKR